MSTNNQKAVLLQYWTDYGGFVALLKSGYFWCAVVITFLCKSIWKDGGWWEDVLSVTPDLMGFALGAYAILIAFGDERFLRLLTAPVPSRSGESGPSIYTTMSSAFMHFIVVQSVAIMSAIVCKGLYVPVPQFFRRILESLSISLDAFIDFTQIFWFFSFLLFVYSIACGVAATSRIYLLTRWFSLHARLSSETQQQQNRSSEITHHGNSPGERPSNDSPTP